MMKHVENGTFGFTILGSGSAGNAAVIHCPQGKILLDAGFSAKELCTRMACRGIAPSEICAILITHEHGDHVKGCRVFADKYDIPTYLTPDTCREMAGKNAVSKRKNLFMAGSPFEICGIRAEPFSIPHDVYDAVAFTFRCGTFKLGFATDLGHLNLLALQKLRDCDALVLESNHDMELLRKSERPLSLKRRIMSRQGHLSNDDALESLKELLAVQTRFLVFAHLSHECNNMEMLDSLTHERLVNLKRDDILFKIAYQEKPLDTFWLC